MNIAIIDQDESFCNEVEGAVLSNGHYSTYKFHSSQDFLGCEQTFDMILLDIESPDTAEISLSDQLRERNTPIVYLSKEHDHLKKTLSGYLKHLKTDEIENVPFTNITYIERNHKDLVVHLSDGENTEIKDGKHYLHDLDDRFIKINHTTYISLDFLESVKDNEAIVHGETLHIGHHHVKELHEIAKDAASKWCSFIVPVSL